MKRWAAQMFCWLMTGHTIIKEREGDRNVGYSWRTYCADCLKILGLVIAVTVTAQAFLYKGVEVYAFQDQAGWHIVETAVG